MTETVLRRNKVIRIFIEKILFVCRHFSDINVIAKSFVVSKPIQNVPVPSSFKINHFQNKRGAGTLKFVSKD